jgi:RNA polymerase sigma-70 factor (ECF subfamily)
LIFRAVEDADLIGQAAQGAVEAYNLLVSRWEKRVYNYLLRITRHREDALDLTQDVFLKAYQNLWKLDDPARFAPWLYRIARNEAYSMFRKRKPETGVDEVEVAAGRADRLTNLRRPAHEDRWRLNRARATQAGVLALGWQQRA